MSAFLIQQHNNRLIVKISNAHQSIKEADISRFFKQYAKVVQNGSDLIILFDARNMTISIAAMAFVQKLTMFFVKLKHHSEKNVSAIATVISNQTLANVLLEAMKADKTATVPTIVHTDILVCKQFLRKYH
jgi:hypothetical protein